MKRVDIIRLIAFVPWLTTYTITRNAGYCRGIENTTFSVNLEDIIKEIQPCGYLQCMRECHLASSCVGIVYRQELLHCALTTKSTPSDTSISSNVDKELLLGTCAQKVCGIDQTSVRLSSGIAVCIDTARNCPSDWKLFKSQCLLFSEDQRDWASSKLQCESEGSSLATVSTQGIYTFLRNQQGTIVKDFWVGAVKHNASVWIWTGTDQIITFPTWLSVVIGEFNGEDCLRMHLDGVLHDKECSVLFRYICQK